MLSKKEELDWLNLFIYKDSKKLKELRESEKKLQDKLDANKRRAKELHILLMEEHYIFHH
jgi:hypothetical protein